MVVSAPSDNGGSGTDPKTVMPSPEQEGPSPQGLIDFGMISKYRRL